MTHVIALEVGQSSLWHLSLLHREDRLYSTHWTLNVSRHVPQLSPLSYTVILNVHWGCTFWNIWKLVNHHSHNPAETGIRNQKQYGDRLWWLRVVLLQIAWWYLCLHQKKDHKISKSDMLDKSVRRANNYLYDTPYLILDFVRYVQSNSFFLQENVL